MTEPTLHISYENGVATMRLARKPANALSVGFLEELDAALADLDQNRIGRS